MTLRVRLLPLGREMTSELALMLSPWVQVGLSVRLVLTQVVMLFPPRVPVIIRNVSAAPLDDLGLQTLMTWFPGRLLTLSVTLRVNELAGTILMPRLGRLFSCTVEFPLKSPLIRVSVALSVVPCPGLSLRPLLVVGLPVGPALSVTTPLPLKLRVNWTFLLHDGYVTRGNLN